MTHERITLLGLPFDTGINKDDILTQLGDKSACRLYSFVNPSAWAMAKRNPDYLDNLEKMDVVLADGGGVALACRLLTGKPSQRISFDMSSLAGPFFSTMALKGLSLMVIGGNPGVDENVHDKIAHHFPGIKMVGSAHGYGELEPKVAAVLAKNPDAVVVGMGVPRQEMFLIKLREAGFKGSALTCGGFFDQYLLADDYYPKWVDTYNLRFAYRLYKEPARLWRRYLLDYPYFGFLFVKAYIEKILGFLDKSS